MVVVIFVAVILGTLGVAAMTMSSSAARQDRHRAIRENAFEVAKAVAEEATLLVNNGGSTVEITQSMADGSVQVPITKTAISDATTAYMGIDGINTKVLIRASAISPDQLPKKTPKERLEQIQKEIDTMGFQGDYLAKLKDFWIKDRGNDGTEESVAEDTDILTSSGDRSFYNKTTNISIESWGPLYVERYKDTDNDPLTPPELQHISPKLKALNDVWALFFTQGNSGNAGCDKLCTKTGTKGPPGASELRAKMDLAMEAVGKDASTRMDSCGSNPALAMSHLVGDINTGKKISSASEVNITSSFLKDSDFGAKTYLLEITSEVEYGGQTARMPKGRVDYTTYHIFQKTEWETAVANMTTALVNDLMGHGVGPSTIRDAWPPETGVEGRDEDVPGHPGLKYDPKKVIMDPVFKHLPSTVGARMYPYTVANAFTRLVNDPNVHGGMGAQNKVKTYGTMN
jgi:hypothetical protein